MQIGMTHLSQSAVLRYMEANKRIRVRSRCPIVQIYERHTPLYVKSVSILGGSIVLNGLSYGALSMYLFLHRKQLVVVRDMRVSTYKTPSFYSSLPKFRAQNLDFHGDGLEDWIPYFDGYSFPLRKLTVYASKIPDTMYNNLTRILIIKFEYPTLTVNNQVSRILTDQTVERVHIDDFGKFQTPLRSQMENALLAWMANGRPIGTCVSFTSDSGLRLASIIDSLELHHGGRAVHFKDEMGRRRTRRATAFSYNPASEIVIYYCKYYDGSWIVCMQMMSTGVAHNGRRSQFFAHNAYFTIADWMVDVLFVVLLFLLVLEFLLWGRYNIQ